MGRGHVLQSDLVKPLKRSQALGLGQKPDVDHLRNRTPEGTGRVSSAKPVHSFNTGLPIRDLVVLLTTQRDEGIESSGFVGWNLENTKSCLDLARCRKNEKKPLPPTDYFKLIKPGA